MDVLVGRGWPQRPRGVLGVERCQAGDEGAVVVVGEESGGVQRVRVGAGAGEVVGHEPPVEVGRP